MAATLTTANSDSATINSIVENPDCALVKPITLFINIMKSSFDKSWNSQKIKSLIIF
jgi:hypothetical protein